MTPRISIALATYNGARFLPAQLETLADQQHPPFELHVGDDGSTDETLAILEDFKGRAPFPVHIVRNPERLGVTANFLSVAARCSSEWIAFCDQDDIWFPDKLARAAAGIRTAGPDLRLVAHNAMITDADLEPRYLKSFWRGETIKRRLALPPHWSCAGFCQIFHRSLVEDIPFAHRFGRPSSPALEAHDNWIGVLANATGSILLIGDPLAYYRRHGGNASHLPETVAPSRSTAAARALRDNSAFYREDAEKARDVSAAIAEAAGLAPEPQVRAVLLDASARMADQADRLDQRADLYREPRLPRRIARLAGLFARGGYVAPARPNFGSAALAKDLVYALRPGKRIGPAS